MKNKDHMWIKQNDSKKQHYKGIYDEYRCENCNITGKLYDDNDNMVKDTPFKAKIYDDCHRAKHQLYKLSKNK